MTFVYVLFVMAACLPSSYEIHVGRASPASYCSEHAHIKQHHGMPASIMLARATRHMRLRGGHIDEEGPEEKEDELAGLINLSGDGGVHKIQRSSGHLSPLLSPGDEISVVVVRMEPMHVNVPVNHPRRSA
jgi:hypothetical protein